MRRGRESVPEVENHSIGTPSPRTNHTSCTSALVSAPTDASEATDTSVVNSCDDAIAGRGRTWNLRVPWDTRRDGSETTPAWEGEMQVRGV